MSYWDIVGDGLDLAGEGSPEGEILEALIAAKIPAAQAERIASALADVYAKQADLRALLTAALRGPAQPPQGEIDKQGSDKVKDSQPDTPPSLDVSGRALIQGNLNVAGNLAVNNLRVFNNAQVDRRLDCNAGNFRSVVIPGGARLGNAVANIDAPLVANGPVLIRQGGRYAGENAFDGRVHLNGQVVWNNRLCQPANAVLTKSLNASGNNKLRVGTQEVFVLRDHGNGPGQGLEWTYEPDALDVVTAVTATTGTTQVTNYSLSPVSGTCVADIQSTTSQAVTAINTASVSWTNYTLAATSVNCVTAVNTAAAVVATGVNTSPVSWTNYTLAPASVNCVTAVNTASAAVITGLNASQVSWTNYTLSEASVNCVTGVQTAPITVITAVGFDATSCAVTSATTTIYAVVSVSASAFAAATYTGSETKTAMASVTASTTNVTSVSSVASGLFQAATYTGSESKTAVASVTAGTTNVTSVASVTAFTFQAATFTGTQTKTAIGTVTASTGTVTAVGSVSMGSIQAATYTASTPVTVVASVTLATATDKAADLTGSVKITATA